MSTPTQAYTVTSADRRALRPTFEELCQNTRLLIKLRWVAGFSILFSSAFARVVLALISSFSPCCSSFDRVGLQHRAVVCV